MSSTRSHAILALVLFAACGIAACDSDSKSENPPGDGGASGNSGTGAAGTSGGVGGNAGTSPGGTAGSVQGGTGGVAGNPAGGSGAAPGCVPGQSIACVCAGGLNGVQVCNQAGTFDPCSCSPGTGGTTGAGGRGGSAGAGASGGTNGASGTGGATGGTGGTTGSSGTGGQGCGDTLSDPKNCGRCGHACRSVPNHPARCMDGQCLPSPGACFAFTAGYTCDAYCASIGETCAQNACRTNDTVVGGYTWMSFYATPYCESVTGSQSVGGECNKPLNDPQGASYYFRCCCTDTK
jgi:hypothetical protein